MIYRIRHNPTGLYVMGSGNKKSLSTNAKYFNTYPDSTKWGTLPRYKDQTIRIKDCVVESIKPQVISSGKLK